MGIDSLDTQTISPIHPLIRRTPQDLMRPVSLPPQAIEKALIAEFDPTILNRALLGVEFEVEWSEDNLPTRLIKNGEPIELLVKTKELDTGSWSHLLRATDLFGEGKLMGITNKIVEAMNMDMWPLYIRSLLRHTFAIEIYSRSNMAFSDEAELELATTVRQYNPIHSNIPVAERYYLSGAFYSYIYQKYGSDVLRKLHENLTKRKRVVSPSEITTPDNTEETYRVQDEVDSPETTTPKMSEDPDQAEALKFKKGLLEQAKKNLWEGCKAQAATEVSRYLQAKVDAKMPLYYVEITSKETNTTVHYCKIGGRHTNKRDLYFTPMVAIESALSMHEALGAAIAGESVTVIDFEDFDNTQTSGRVFVSPLSNKLEAGGWAIANCILNFPVAWLDKEVELNLYVNELMRTIRHEVAHRFDWGEKGTSPQLEALAVLCEHDGKFDKVRTKLRQFGYGRSVSQSMLANLLCGEENGFESALQMALLESTDYPRINANEVVENFILEISEE